MAFTPVGAPRTYRLSPMSYRERARFQRLTRAAAHEPPDRVVMLGVLRECLIALNPSNIGEALAQVDEAEAAPDDKPAQARLAVLERAVRDIPAYGEMLEDQRRYAEERAVMAVRTSLRGWAGDGLPVFVRDDDGLVPESLLDAIPAAEFEAVASRALALIWLGPSALGNLEAPSPSPASPAPTQEG